MCVACSQGKLITWASPVKRGNESLIYWEQRQGNICKLVDPSCGQFRYFMVLIDISTWWSHVCLLSAHNMALVRLLAQLIRLRVYFPEYLIKKMSFDNANEFTSQTFIDYYIFVGIDVEHSIAHVHTQNYPA